MDKQLHPTKLVDKITFLMPPNSLLGILSPIHDRAVYSTMCVEYVKSLTAWARDWSSFYIHAYILHFVNTKIIYIKPNTNWYTAKYTEYTDNKLTINLLDFRMSWYLQPNYNYTNSLGNSYASVALWGTKLEYATIMLHNNLVMVSTEILCIILLIRCVH